jgi:hypothetical protein
MPAEIITIDDLWKFKIEILQEFKKMLKEHNGQPTLHADWVGHFL